MKKYRKNDPKNRKETVAAIRTWFLSFFIIMIIFAIVLPEDETGHTSIPAYCSFVAIIVPTVFAVLNLNKKGKSLLSFGRSFVVGFITWFALTGLFMYIDSQSHLSDLTEWYALVGIFFPIIAAVFIVWLKPISLLKRTIDRKIYGLEEHEFDPHVQNRFCNFEITPVEMLPGSTNNEYALSYIEFAKEYANKINRSTTVEDFSVALNMVKDYLQKLAWFNEKKSVFMNPTPRNNFRKICENMENTINDFISRAVNELKRKSSTFQKDIECLIWDIEHNAIFCEFMTIKNREKILELKELASLNIAHKQPPKNSMTQAPIKVTEDMHTAAQIVFETGQASVSMIQRRMVLGYSRAARLIDNLESAGIIGPFEGSAPRKTLISEEEYFSRYQIVDIFPDDLPYQTKENSFSSFDCTYIIQEEENWRREQMGLSPKEYELQKIDGMDGHDFEHWCAELLKKNKFTDVEVTKGSGDQGVDVLAVKDGVRYAIQCKCYSSNLGNGPVQEVHAGKALYHCQVGVVMTNQYFTAGATELAAATGVLLWDRDKLKAMIEDCI